MMSFQEFSYKYNSILNIDNYNCQNEDHNLLINYTVYYRIKILLQSKIYTCISHVRFFIKKNSKTW